MSVEPNDEKNEELLALRVLENIYAADAAHEEAVDAAAIQRMRAAIDQAFARAWKEVHAQAEAEARAPARARSRPNLAGMSREALLARLLDLQAQQRAPVQVAFRNGGHVSDDDLRAMIEDLEKDAAKAGPDRGS